MEISQFLQSVSTLSLRQKFLSVENERRKNIISLLQELKISKLKTTNENIEKIHTIFHETHKLKGAGGTYGFSEMSLFYSELLKYVKPSSQEQRVYTNNEFRNINKLLTSWSKFYNKYSAVFNKLLEQENIKKIKGILFVSQNRNDFFNSLLLEGIKNKKNFFSCYNYEDVVLGIKYIDIEFCLIELNNKNRKVLELMNQFLKEKNIFYFDEHDNEVIKNEILLSYKKTLEEKTILLNENSYLNIL